MRRYRPIRQLPGQGPQDEKDHAGDNACLSKNDRPFGAQRQKRRDEHAVEGGAILRLIDAKPGRGQIAAGVEGLQGIAIVEGRPGQHQHARRDQHR